VRAVSIDGPDTLPPWARRPTLVSRLNETIPPNFLNLPAFAEGGERMWSRRPAAAARSSPYNSKLETLILSNSPPTELTYVVRAIDKG
jgi:hypothetical protein